MPQISSCAGTTLEIVPASNQNCGYWLLNYTIMLIMIELYLFRLQPALHMTVVSKCRTNPTSSSGQEVGCPRQRSPTMKASTFLKSITGLENEKKKQRFTKPIQDLLTSSSRSTFMCLNKTHTYVFVFVELHCSGPSLEWCPHWTWATLILIYLQVIILPNLKHEIEQPHLL